MLKFNNLVFDIDSSEIFLNVFKIYNDNEKGSGSELIKKILNKMSNKEISDLLRDLKVSKYLKFVSRIELILRHIISENLTEKYKNNKDIFKIFLINSEPEPFSLSLYILKTFKNISLESISNTRLIILSINLSIKSLLLLYKLLLNKEFINLFLI